MTAPPKPGILGIPVWDVEGMDWLVVGRQEVCTGHSQAGNIRTGFQKR